MESKHLLILEDGKGRREIPLGDDVYTFGRDPTCNIPVFSMFVTRCGAVLRRQMRDDGTVYYQIHDGNLKGKRSIHGLLVNGRRVEIHDLENEDEILLSPEVVIKYYKIDVPPQPDTVQNWEAGRHIPKLSPNQMKALCDLLKFTLEDLAD